MIKSIAELLDTLRVKEAAALDRVPNVEHGPMIGDMYEGLTRSLLRRVVFDGLDLKVVDGKVRYENGRLSRQLDAMVVVGDGDRLPHTEHYIYPIEQVLVVVEVKKTLYGDELASAYQNLQSVSHMHPSRSMSVRRLSRLWRTLMLMELPDDLDLSSYPPTKSLMAHTLLREAGLPVRIALGYAGYATERGLRKGLLDYLAGLDTTKGPIPHHGPASLPNVIACKDSALVKLNAMPYAMTHGDSDEHWLCYASVQGHVGRVLLEVIWTRLASHFQLPPDMFGDDLESEPLRPLLWAIPVERDETALWSYKEASPHSFTEVSQDGWTPVALTPEEASIVHILCEEGEIDMSDPAFVQYAKTRIDGFADLLERLKIARIAAVDNHGRLRLLTDLCQVVTMPNGIFVGDNNSGRLSRWVAREMNRRRRGA